LDAAIACRGNIAARLGTAVLSNGGEFGFVLRNPVLLKPFPVKGSLQLFNVDVREKDLKKRR
jgi:hypothetical protein